MRMFLALISWFWVFSAIAQPAPFQPAFHEVKTSVLKQNFRYYPDRGMQAQTIAIYFGGPYVGNYSAGVFAADVPSDQVTSVAIGKSEFVERWVQRSAQGYVPRDISAQNDERHIAKFSVIWEKANVPAAFFIDMSDAGFDSRYAEYTSQGYRLAEYARYTSRVGNRPPEQKHVAVFRKDGQGFYFHRGLDAAQARQWFSYYEARGFAPHSINVGTYTTGPGIAILFRPRTYQSYMNFDMTAAGYQQDFDARVRANYRLVKVTGYGNPVRFATIWYKNESY